MSATRRAIRWNLPNRGFGSPSNCISRAVCRVSGFPNRPRSESNSQQGGPDGQERICLPRSSICKEAAAWPWAEAAFGMRARDRLWTRQNPHGPGGHWQRRRWPAESNVNQNRPANSSQDGATVRARAASRRSSRFRTLRRDRRCNAKVSKPATAGEIGEAPNRVG